MAQGSRPPSPNIKPRHRPVLCGGYSPLELEVVQILKARDLKKSLEHCHDPNQNERRAGLCNLLIYMRRGDTCLSDSDVTLVRDTLKRFFPEHSSKLYRVFLEVLHDFIQLYCESLEGWMETVVRRLLDRLGSELLASLQLLIKKILSSLQLCYVPGFLFRVTARVISRNESFEKKSKLAALDYFGELLPLLQPEDFYDHSDLERCLLALTTDLSTTNSNLRLRTQDIMSVLFDLNPTTFNLFLSRLPEKLVDNLKRSIRRHWAKVIENENLSPRKTFRAPPHEDMRGRVQRDQKLKKHISLTDLLHFPSDSEETSSNEQLSKSFSVNVTADSKLALYSLNKPLETQSYSQPTLTGSQSDIPIPESLPAYIPISDAPPIPTSEPPPITPTDCFPNPSDMSTSQSYPTILMQPLDISSSPSLRSAELPQAICTPLLLPNENVQRQGRTPEGVTRSRIPVSVNYSPRISSQERAKILQLFSLEKKNTFFSKHKNVGPTSRPCCSIHCNPFSSNNTPSRIPRYQRSASLCSTSLSSPSQLRSAISADISCSDKIGNRIDKTDPKQPSNESTNQAILGTNSSREERRGRVCLDFGCQNNKSLGSLANTFKEGAEANRLGNIQAKVLANSDTMLAPKLVTLVAHPLSGTPPSCGREEDLSTSIDTSSAALPSDSIEEELSVPAASHSCHELQTASSTSLDSEGESPTSLSLKSVLNSFLSADGLEPKIEALNELREKLKSYNLVSAPAESYFLVVSFSQAVSELVSFSSQVKEKTLLISIHTIFLISQLFPSLASQHTESIVRLLITSHSNSTHMTRIKLEDIFILISQVLDQSLVLSTTRGYLPNVTINYLTPLKLLSKLIPNSHPHILSLQLPELAPAIVSAYQQPLGIQNAALPCLVGLCNALGAQVDSYLTGLSPSQDKLLKMYVKSSSKKREM